MKGGKHICLNYVNWKVSRARYELRPAGAIYNVSNLVYTNKLSRDSGHGGVSDLLKTLGNRTNAWNAWKSKPSGVCQPPGCQQADRG